MYPLHRRSLLQHEEVDECTHSSKAAGTSNCIGIHTVGYPQGYSRNSTVGGWVMRKLIRNEVGGDGFGFEFPNLKYCIRLSMRKIL